MREWLRGVDLPRRSLDNNIKLMQSSSTAAVKLARFGTLWLAMPQQPLRAGAHLGVDARYVTVLGDPYGHEGGKYDGYDSA